MITPEVLNKVIKRTNAVIRRNFKYHGRLTDGDNVRCLFLNFLHNEVGSPMGKNVYRLRRSIKKTIDVRIWTNANGILDLTLEPRTNSYYYNADLERDFATALKEVDFDQLRSQESEYDNLPDYQPYLGEISDVDFESIRNINF